jgi:hypothetical protein
MLLLVSLIWRSTAGASKAVTVVDRLSTVLSTGDAYSYTASNDMDSVVTFTGWSECNGAPSEVELDGIIETDSSSD